MQHIDEDVNTLTVVAARLAHLLWSSAAIRALIAMHVRLVIVTGDQTNEPEKWTTDAVGSRRGGLRSSRRVPELAARGLRASIRAIPAPGSGPAATCAEPVCHPDHTFEATLDPPWVVRGRAG